MKNPRAIVLVRAWIMIVRGPSLVVAHHMAPGTKRENSHTKQECQNPDSEVCPSLNQTGQESAKRPRIKTRNTGTVMIDAAPLENHHNHIV